MQAGMSISDSPLTEPKPVLPMIECLLAPRLRRRRYLGVRTAVIPYVRDSQVCRNGSAPCSQSGAASDHGLQSDKALRTR